MDHSKALILTAHVLVGLVHSANIPSHIKGCKRSDPNLNNCVVKVMNEVLPYIIDGDKDYAVPVLEPFTIDHVGLSERNGQGLDIALNYTNVKVRGLRDTVIETGTRVDVEKQTFVIKIAVPTLTLQALYNVEGRILVLPIRGFGDSNLTLGNMKATFDSDYTLQMGKDGQEHAKLANSKLDFTVDSFNIYLANLFNGEQTLGDQMNIFLNENWQELLMEFGPILRETIRTIIFTTVDKMSFKVPFETLLPK